VKTAVVVGSGAGGAMVARELQGSFEVTVLAFDGRTGAKLFQETFKDQKEKSRRAADEMVGLFENLFSLENQLLGLFIVREREANRYVFN